MNVEDNQSQLSPTDVTLINILQRAFKNDEVIEDGKLHGLGIAPSLLDGDLPVRTLVWVSPTPDVEISDDYQITPIAILLSAELAARLDID